jgi:peroxiredoxin
MKPVQIAQIAFIAAACVGVYSFVRAAQNDQRLSTCTALCEMRPTYAGRDRSVPDFELPNMDGTPTRFSSFTGKTPVVLNFWTKTCKPCLEEMPALAELALLLKPRGIPVVTVCTDEGPDEVRDTLQVVLNGQPPPFHILFDPDMEVVGDMFGTSLFPETWLVDNNNVIRARFDGARNWSGAMALEVLEMLGRPGGCPVSFRAGHPAGAFAGLCADED